MTSGPIKLLTYAGFLASIAASAHAQSSEDLAKKLSNPIASADQRSIPVQL